MSLDIFAMKSIFYYCENSLLSYDVSAVSQVVIKMTKKQSMTNLFFLHLLCPTLLQLLAVSGEAIPCVIFLALHPISQCPDNDEK